MGSTPTGVTRLDYIDIVIFYDTIETTMEERLNSYTRILVKAIALEAIERGATVENALDFVSDFSIPRENKTRIINQALLANEAQKIVEALVSKNS